jgi:hypothetical protein
VTTLRPKWGQSASSEPEASTWFTAISGGCVRKSCHAMTAPPAPSEAITECTCGEVALLIARPNSGQSAEAICGSNASRIMANVAAARLRLAAVAGVPRTAGATRSGVS